MRRNSPTRVGDFRLAAQVGDEETKAHRQHLSFTPLRKAAESRLQPRGHWHLQRALPTVRCLLAGHWVKLAFASSESRTVTKGHTNETLLRHAWQHVWGLADGQAADGHSEIGGEKNDSESETAKEGARRRKKTHLDQHLGGSSTKLSLWHSTEWKEGRISYTEATLDKLGVRAGEQHRELERMELGGNGKVQSEPESQPLEHMEPTWNRPGTWDVS